MNIPCSFEDYTQANSTTTFYTCIVKKINIPVKEKVLKFKGIHQSNKGNDDVKKISFRNCVMRQVPQGISEFFKNIEGLIVRFSGIKSITKFDLKPFTNLTHLDLSGNELESLPADLFEFTKNIEQVYFSQNKLKYIGPELLDDLQNLQVASFLDNENINSFFNEGYERRGINTLKTLKEKIRLDCKQPSESSEDEEASSSESEDEETPGQTFSLDDFSDFTIIIDSQEFKIHKFIFAAKSEVFARFTKTNPDSTSLIFEDISIEGFKCILKFVYTNKLDMKFNAYEVFESACILKIESLVKFTAKSMISIIESERNLESLYKIFKLSIKFNHDELKLKAFDEIRKQFTGKTLPDELAEQPDKLKKFIDAKMLLDQL